MAGGLGHFLDGLHAGRTGADDRDALALEADRFVRPAGGVAGLAAEGLDPLDAGHGRGRERADGGDQEAGGVAGAVFQRHVPGSRGFLPVGGGDPAVELDVAAEVELVGDVVQIAQGLGLGGEVLDPVPFIQQLLREENSRRSSFRKSKRAPG